MNVELKYRKSYEETQKHLNRLKKAFEILKSQKLIPLDSQKIENILNDEYLTAILDQIVYRYSKLQDSLSKLIRSYLYLKGENVENLTMVDVLNKDEKSKIAETLNKIYKELGYLKNLLERLKL